MLSQGHKGSDDENLACYILAKLDYNALDAILIYKIAPKIHSKML